MHYPASMRCFLPPETDEILPLVAARNARRLAGVSLDAAWLRREFRWEVSALESSLRDLLDAERLGLLTHGGVRIRTAVARRVRAWGGGA